ncbi:hypothetical protein EVAR_45517_1 [Eumeta japonica]|uniref:Uncharacterized protein n=1 Tax=Eumeta variegata TaxID=151549 RepID=A0A4C1XAP2_EUMVA|nr:hypothetical protein EVAR_45517_1 [Eumeta japonica]
MTCFIRDEVSKETIPSQKATLRGSRRVRADAHASTRGRRAHTDHPRPRAAPRPRRRRARQFIIHRCRVTMLWYKFHVRHVNSETWRATARAGGVRLSDGDGGGGAGRGGVPVSNRSRLYFTSPGGLPDK